MALHPLKDPPQLQAWASDGPPGFVMPAGGAPQSSQGASHSSHGRRPRPHKHRGLPAQGNQVPIQGFSLKMGTPSQTLRLPLFHRQLCVFNYQAQRVCLGWGGTTVSPVPATSLADTLCAAAVRTPRSSRPAPAHVREEGAKQTHAGSPVPVSAARGITHASPHGPARAPWQHT